jgi:hypothetical protein
MTCEQFEDILPQLLDDDAMAVPPAARLHLEGCVECKTLYDDLTGIRTSAASLPPITPSRDLWSGIEARIRTPIVPLVEGMPISKPRRQVSLRSAAIAAGVLALINAGISYKIMDRPAPPLVASADPVMPAPAAMRTAVRQQPMMALPLPVPVTPAASPRRSGGSTILLATNGPIVDEQGPDRQQQPRNREQAKLVYDREISRLRAVVDSGRHKLDPATAALLDRNLRIIDAAIEQCNLAIRRDSSSTFLIESLNNVYQTKVKLLRIAAAAASR